MLQVILSILYMTVVCLGFGSAVICGINKLLHKENYSIIAYIIAGIIGITVYVQFFSLVGKIAVLAHIIMVAIAVWGFVLDRERIRIMINEVSKVTFSWEGLVYVCFVIFISFFVSRGDFHTDTNIYHAAAIRMYEEYGILKGLGNLQLHYAYNSSSLAFASIFSMKWLFGLEHANHSTTGFYAVICGIYAMYNLKRIKERKNHIADAVDTGILIYVLVCLYRAMSPATDYPTMFLALLVISMWCREMEGNRRIDVYALLSVLAVFVVTMKFSACVLVLIVLYPAVRLIKDKKWKDIVVYLCLGILILLPFLVRNVVISGWILYPFEGLDLFNVKWKIPLEQLQNDSAQIKVWGRGLFDVTKLDWGVREWLPVWQEQRERYELMLIYGMVVGIIGNFMYIVRFFVKKAKFRWEILVLYAGILACLMVWFTEAPFIRYGLAFILTVILLPIGCFLSEEHRGFWGIVSGLGALTLVFCTTPYINNYITDMGVFVKRMAKDPYYLVQKSYDKSDMGTLDFDGETIYFCDDLSETNSYYVCPGTCYQEMVENSKLIDGTIKSGFMPK